MPTLNATIEGFLSLREYDGGTIGRLQFWSQEFGERDLTDIDPEAVDAALSRLAERGALRPQSLGRTLRAGKPLAGATIDRYVAQLASIYKYARRLRLIPRAHVPPTKGVELHGSPVDPERYLRAEEVERLLKVARLLDRRWGKLTALIVLAFHTGLRRGNLLALRWRDLDLEARTVSVAVTKNGHPITQPLSERAAEELSRLPGRKHAEELVFCGRRNQPFAFRKLWLKVTKEAGLEGHNFHQLRHGCGHALATAGVNQASIMAHMGHRSLGASQRYLHANVRDKRRVMDEVFG